MNHAARAARSWASGGLFAASTVHLVSLCVAASTLLLAGQPLYANDTWIHLALGESFLEAGPWLERDPHLFAAPGPPAPSAWLGSSLLFAVLSFLGFAGLRALHFLLVLSLLVLAHRIARRATGSPVVGSFALVAFVALSTFRLVQLRPELFTLLGTFLLWGWALADRRGPKGVAALGIGLLVAVWANLHAGFVLGPVLLLGTAAGLALLSRLPGAPAGESERAGRLARAGLAAVVGGCLNPQGWRAYAAYFTAGGDTLGLAAVADEWSPTNLLAWPVPLLPPTWAAWCLAWLCVIATMVAAVLLLSERLGGREGLARGLDPALVGWSVAGLAAAWVASRFLWLCVFGAILAGFLLFEIGRGSGAAERLSSWGRRGLVALTVLTAALHFTVGDWPLVSRAVRRDPGSYGEPYRIEKFFGHAMWFLADSRVGGRIFNDYPLGGFMSFWLSPPLSIAASGTMNVEREAMGDFLAINALGAGAGSAGVGTLLDQHDFDVFLGTGLPVSATRARAIPSTVRHVEGDANWIQVFRSLRSAVYLRRPDASADLEASSRRARNLARVSAFFDREGVPFDRERGFDPVSAARRNPAWAAANGIVPRSFVELDRAARDEVRRGGFGPASDRLAELFAVLGAYEESIALSRGATRGPLERLDRIALERSYWCALQRGDLAEAAGLARRLDALEGVRGPGGHASGVASLRAIPLLERAALIHGMPLFGLDRAYALQSDVTPPAARPFRPRTRELDRVSASSGGSAPVF